MARYTDATCSMCNASCYLDISKSCTNVIQANLDGHMQWSRADFSLPGLIHRGQIQAGAQSPSSCSPAQPRQCISVGQNSPSSSEDLTMGWEQSSHSSLATVPEEQAR